MGTERVSGEGMGDVNWRRVAEVREMVERRRAR